MYDGGLSTWTLNSIRRVKSRPDFTPETFSTSDMIALEDGELLGNPMTELTSYLVHLNLITS